MFKLKHGSLQKVALAICGKKGLNLTTDQRRELQIDVVGKASMKDMTCPELEDFIVHLRRLQGAAKPTVESETEWRFVFKMSPERQSYAKKIYRLAERVGQLMAPPAPVASKAYIEGITAQMRGADQPLEFCDCAQLHKVIQALEVYLKRHGA